MKIPEYYIIDFDSTFIKIEALDALSAVALKNNPKKDEIVAKISDITKQGMEGEIPFPVSLSKRLALFKANKNHIESLIKILKKNISSSVARNKNFFKENSESIYIISGGFKEYIIPLVKPFGISEKHVLANTFTFDKKGNITGYDENNLLSQKNGKSKQVKKLQLKGNVTVIGDGYTDFEIKEKGAADKFYAFTENVSRGSVIQKADKVIADFDDFLYRLRLPRALSFPKSRMKVLLLENIHSKAKEYFEKDGYEIETLVGALDEDGLIEKIKDVSILGIRSKTKITKKVIDNAPKLLSIGAFCIGTNQIDMAACSDAGVAVFNAPYSNTRSVVELVVGEIIMLYRKAFDKSSKLHAGVWDKSAKNCHEIRGHTLGIVGYGNIGSQLSVVAENLGMEVIFYDMIDKLAYGNAKRCDSLDELLKKADVVTIHVDGRKSNTNLIDEKEFAMMKDGVIFINASRGFIVNIEALVEAIKNGKIAGAAVDVFPKEPKSNNDPFKSELQNLPNVILTPHIGAGTEEAQQNIADFVSGRLMSFIDDGDTTMSVNIPNLQLPELKKHHRFIHIHKNVPGILAKINTILAEHKINIEGQYLKTNENIGYVISDVGADYNIGVVKMLKKIPDTIRVRVLY